MSKSVSLTFHERMTPQLLRDILDCFASDYDIIELDCAGVQFTLRHKKRGVHIA